jgi:hypothetical protein
MALDFNIEAFKSRFSGGARGYLFYFLPRFPAGISVGGMDSDTVTYLVKTTSLPENTKDEGIIPWQGMDFKYASKSTFTDFTVNFNVDRKAKIRVLYENWMDLIHNPVTNEFSPIDVYMVDQRVQLLDYDGSPTVTYTLFNAWPKTLGPIELDYAGTEVAMFDVTFTYTHHKVEENA